VIAFALHTRLVETLAIGCICLVLIYKASIGDTEILSVVGWGVLFDFALI